MIDFLSINRGPMFSGSVGGTSYDSSTSDASTSLENSQAANAFSQQLDGEMLASEEQAQATNVDYTQAKNAVDKTVA